MAYSLAATGQHYTPHKAGEATLPTPVQGVPKGLSRESLEVYPCLFLSPDWGGQVLNFPGWPLKEPAHQWSRTSLKKEPQLLLQNLRRPLGFPESLFTHPYCAQGLWEPAQ